MPLTPRRDYQVPDFWTVFGHSFMNYSFGTYFQTGRADSIFRASLDIEHTNWQNYAVSGARVTTEGASTGGYVRALRRINRPQRGGPYVADGGAALFCYGINDMGLNGVTAQVRGAYVHAMRTLISLWRASVIYENNFQVGTRTSYGAGFGAIGADYTTNGSVHWATATTNAHFTLTLPSDYTGEAVSILLVGAAGTSGGTVTWSGTAGVTGTTSVSDIMPTAAATHAPVVKRITNLTAANAGQTIVGTVTQLDAGGAVMLDCWWLEAKAPPPVIVCNISRLTAAGYTGNYPSWAGTESSRDADVNTWNADLRTLVAEFDPMVQIADIDGALAKTYYSSDGLHPDERGAARIADACRDAMRRLTPTSDSPTFNLNPSAPRVGGTLKPHRSGLWYSSDYQTTIATGVASTIAAAGSLWAIPFWVTNPRERITRLAMQVGSTAGTACTIRWGLYDDIGWSGYPQERVAEPTAAGALSTGTTANAVVMSAASGTGSINQYLDPGLYWLALLSVTATAQTWVQLQGPNWVMPQINGASGAPVTTVAAAPNGWKATGVSTSALPATFPAGAVATAGAPYIGAQITINPMNV